MQATIVAALATVWAALGLLERNPIYGIGFHRVKTGPPAIPVDADQSYRGDQVVVDCMGCRQSIERNDTGCMNIIVGDVSLLTALLRSEGLLLQTSWADELVAPQTTVTGEIAEVRLTS